jgi:hypothetical protein
MDMSRLCQLELIQGCFSGSDCVLASILLTSVVVWQEKFVDYLLLNGITTSESSIRGH